MRLIAFILVLMTTAANSQVRLITVDPGHFHASLVQKEMYPGVSKTVSIYAPLGFDLTEHLNRIARFNLRAENPTAWELEVHTGPDYMERMLREKPGNVVVLSGRNRVKMDRILASVKAGLNVFSDKPWVIAAANLPKLEDALNTAEQKGLVAYDLMTERYEPTSALQKELVNDPDIFGEIEKGDEQNPGVYMESVHHIMKIVSGVPNLRPAWFFDVLEQGEGLTDVGTHLVDLTNWTLFPKQILDYRKDVRMLTAKRWPTTMTKAEYQRVTGEALKTDSLDYFCNNQVSYTVRGVHVKFDVLWRYEAPAGGLDTHYAVYRGTKSRIEVRQGAEHELWVIPKSPVIVALRKRVATLLTDYPGIAVSEQGEKIRVTIPASLRTGHESHFAQVATRFFSYLKNPKSMPAWEKANMLAKYYITTQGVELSHKSGSGR